MSTSNTLSSGTPLEILALESLGTAARLINALCRVAMIDTLTAGHLHEHRNYGKVCMMSIIDLEMNASDQVPSGRRSNEGANHE